jgi:hypothetical protein
MKRRDNISVVVPAIGVRRNGNRILLALLPAFYTQIADGVSHDEATFLVTAG